METMIKPEETAEIVDPEPDPQNQLANLTPWRPGQSGNPGGLPEGYVAPSRALRAMLGSAALGRVDLDEIAKGPAGLAKALALEILAACRPRERWAIDRKGNAHPAGSDPEPGRALERILDRVEGKPMVRMEIEKTDTRPIEAVEADIAALVAADPALRAMLLLRLGTPEPAALEAKNEAGGTPNGPDDDEGETPHASSADSVVSQETPNISPNNPEQSVRGLVNSEHVEDVEGPAGGKADGQGDVCAAPEGDAPGAARDSGGSSGAEAKEG